MPRDIRGGKTPKKKTTPESKFLLDKKYKPTSLPEDLQKFQGEDPIEYAAPFAEEDEEEENPLENRHVNEDLEKFVAEFKGGECALRAAADIFYTEEETLYFLLKKQLMNENEAENVKEVWIMIINTDRSVRSIEDQYKNLVGAIKAIEHQDLFEQYSTVLTAIMFNKLNKLIKQNKLSNLEEKDREKMNMITELTIRLLFLKENPQHPVNHLGTDHGVNIKRCLYLAEHIAPPSKSKLNCLSCFRRSKPPPSFSEIVENIINTAVKAPGKQLGAG